jgi:hypothetical protein
MRIVELLPMNDMSLARRSPTRREWAGQHHNIDIDKLAPNLRAGRRSPLAVPSVACRLLSYAADRKLRALHGSVLFLQAQKLGFVVLTANTADFDILLQLIPAGRALSYR